MSGFNATPEDGSAMPIPLSSAVSPGDKTPRAIMGGAEMTDSQGNILVPVAEEITTGPAIALTTPPTTTNAAANTVLTFVQQAKHWQIQNNSPTNVYVELDAVASTGSTLLLPNSQWRDDIPVTSPNIYTPVAVPVNAVNGLIVRGWA